MSLVSLHMVGPTLNTELRNKAQLQTCRGMAKGTKTKLRSGMPASALRDLNLSAELWIASLTLHLHSDFFVLLSSGHNYFSVLLSPSAQGVGGSVTKHVFLFMKIRLITAPV